MFLWAEAGDNPHAASHPIDRLTCITPIASGRLIGSICEETAAGWTGKKVLRKEDAEKTLKHILFN
jgi:hypothetical protein